MVRPFPTEILERIIFYYFQRDQLLHTPEDDFTLVTPTRGSTSLLLVSKGFRLLVLPSLFYSISVTEQRHWELLFRTGSGLMDGDGEAAKTRRKWVREVRMDPSVRLPVALGPDGSLSPNPLHESKEQGDDPFRYDEPSAGLIRFSNLDPWHSNPRSLFLNLDRITLLPSSSRPWPSRLLRQLEDRHLRLYRKSVDDPLAAFPEEKGTLGDVVRGWSLMENEMKKRAFLPSLGAKGLWIGLKEEDRNRVLATEWFWSRERLRKFLVCFPPPAASPSTRDASLLDDPSIKLPTHLLELLLNLADFEELPEMGQNLRFVGFPSSPRVRRRFWGEAADEMGESDVVDDLVEEDEEGREVGDIMLEVVKEKNWAWVEEDRREVDFEEGMRLVEEVEES